jgi:hypothetical protein
MKMRTTTIVKSVEMATVAKSTVHEEMAKLDDPSQKASMKVIAGRRKVERPKIVGLSLSDRKVIVLKLVAPRVPDVLMVRANISRNPIIKGHLINRNMVSLQCLRMVHRDRLVFILR